MSSPISPETGHIHSSPRHDFIHFDPYVELSNGKKLHGKHGIMDIRAEVAQTAFENNMLDSPVIQRIITGH